jgi:carbon-monoxide dehydrogenase medium subunit
VKPPPFGYLAPTTVDDAVAALHDAAGTGKVLAGGQSLLQDLRWCRVHPTVLVDIGGIDELAGISVTAEEVRIGARVRHRDLEHPEAVPGPLGTLLARAASHVAHPPVRSRGTIVGSLAWAHPASEWCGIAAGLGGRVELASMRGRRTVPVAEFLVGPGRTTCDADELVTALLLPRLPDSVRVAFREQRRTHASFAQVAVAVAVEKDDDGTVTRADIGLSGAAPTAVRAETAGVELCGTCGGPDDRAHAAAVAARDDADPVAEPHAGVAYRRNLVDVLLRRVLEEVA